MRKLFVLLLALAVCLSAAGCGEKVQTAVPTETASSVEEAAAAKTEDVVILYTNDVHTYIDGPLNYAVLAGLKTRLEAQYGNVLLVDAGDHVQGTAFGSMDKGKHMIELMNAVGYDLATLGNHEFDYGMTGCENVVQWAEYPYISCNFYREEQGVRCENVLEAVHVFETGGRKIGFVGITTPETFTKSTPAYFQDAQGNYIYGIAGGQDGAALYADVQAGIDAAKAAGAEVVIALGHLGDDLSSRPWTSQETIANVSGLDAFIDGHSHSAVAGQEIADKEGNPVLLTQTGEYFGTIGCMHIDGETGQITTELIGYEQILETVRDSEGNPVLNEDGTEVTAVAGYELASSLYDGPVWCEDETVAGIQKGWIDEINDQLGQVIGTANVVLDNYDEAGSRLVRGQETNTGDFAADALYYLFDDMGLDVDVAVMNGGGIRNQALTGDLSYLSAKEIHTFGNVACLQTVTGQQLLDALEWGARSTGTGEENGSFLHVSGITYKIDTQWPVSVQEDDKGVWIGGPTGGYRVHDVRVYNRETNAYEPLDLTASYNMAGYNYTLRDLGGGFNMFGGAVNVLDYVMEDYMVLAYYMEAFENNTIEAANSPLLQKYSGMLLDYGNVNGSGRILLESDIR